MNTISPITIAFAAPATLVQLYTHQLLGIVGGAALPC